MKCFHFMEGRNKFEGEVKIVLFQMEMESQNCWTNGLF